MSSRGGRTSAHGWSSFNGEHTVDRRIEEGLRATVGVLQVIGMGMVVGIPPLVVGPVIGHLASINLTISQNNFNGRS